MCQIPLTVLIFLPPCRNTLGHHAVYIANIGDQLTTCSCWLSTLHDVASFPNTLRCFIGSILTQPSVNNEKPNHLCKKIREGASTNSRLPCGESRKVEQGSQYIVTAERNLPIVSLTRQSKKLFAILYPSLEWPIGRCSRPRNSCNDGCAILSLHLELKTAHPNELGSLV